MPMPASRFCIPPRWKRLGALILALATIMAARPYGVSSAPANQAAYDLIDEVNALRSANGLAPYNIDPILMAVAQAHTDYQVSIGSTTHYSADGSRPRDRAIAAGYGGGATVFISENIAGGTGLTPAEAVGWWQGDDLHLNTMLGPNYTDVGAGAGESGGVWRYTLDAGYVAGGSYVPPTSAGSSGAGATPVSPGFILSTPAADGSIVHVVQAGQTLWTIAAYYGVDIDTLRQLNNLPTSPLLRIGQEIIVQPAMTQTSSPAPTKAVTHTLTPSATSTRRVFTQTPRPSPSPTPGPTAQPLGTTSWILIGAGGGLMALGIAAALLRRDNRSQG
jgi:LysM repeat protein